MIYEKETSIKQLTEKKYHTTRGDQLVTRKT